MNATRRGLGIGRLLHYGALVAGSALLAESIVFLAFGAPGYEASEVTDPQGNRVLVNVPTLFPAPQAVLFLFGSLVALAGLLLSRRGVAWAGAVMLVVFAVWLTFSIGTWFLPVALILLITLLLGGATSEAAPASSENVVARPGPPGPAP